MNDLESPLVDSNYRMPIAEVDTLKRHISDFIKDGIGISEEDIGSGRSCNQRWWF